MTPGDRVVVVGGPWTGRCGSFFAADGLDALVRFDGDGRNRPPCRVPQRLLAPAVGDAAPTRLDAIRDAVLEELAHNADALRGDRPPANVSLIIYLDDRTGRPRRVSFRTESSRDLPREGSGR